MRVIFHSVNLMTLGKDLNQLMSHRMLCEIGWRYGQIRHGKYMNLHIFRYIINIQTVWSILAIWDSNPGMTESKSVALPLG